MNEASHIASEPFSAATSIDWPVPAHLGSSLSRCLMSPQPCEIEGINGQVRSCLLVNWNPAQQQAYIQVPPSRTTVALRFDMFRRLTLTTPSILNEHANTLSSDDRMNTAGTYPQGRRPYHLAMMDGSLRQGNTIGCIENEAGLFLFEPMDQDNRIQRIFIPRAAYKHFVINTMPQTHQVNPPRTGPEPQQTPLETPQNTLASPTVFSIETHEVITIEQLLAALEEQQRMPLIRIGQALIALGFITPAQLEEALQRQRQEKNLPLGELLVQSGKLTREQLRIALARKMGYPIVNLNKFPIDPEALRRVPLTTARKLHIVPILWHQGSLIIAAEDPTRRATVDELEFSLQCKVIPTLASAQLDPKTIGAIYGRLGMDSPALATTPENTDSQPLSAEALLESLQADENLQEEPTAAVEQSDNALVRLINSIIIEAHQQGASDIHIETFPDKRKIRVRLRKDGRLHPYMELPHTYRAALVARIKIMCDLDISERRKPQDGKIDFSRFSPQHRIELRVATIPTYGGAEDVVLRILASARAMRIDEIGLSTKNQAALLAASQRPHGLILCVGPTGSGKTTTLHALLQHLNTPDRKIWTAEDPIEITHPDLRQVQVNPKIDWTFDKALRAFLRADPDIIMVGEIRDSETARIAVEASLTGHLVLSTLHTNSAAETVVRLLDMGIDPFNFADSLTAVLAQRLVRKLCQHCAQFRPANPAELEELIEDYRLGFPEAIRPSALEVQSEWADILPTDNLQLGIPVGCPACDQTGYKGRIGIHELITVDAALRRLIQTKAPAEALQHAAITHGHFRSLRQDGILKVLRGLTTLDEVRANTAT